MTTRKRAWDHKLCAGHFRTDGFSKRLCFQADESKDEAVAFATMIAELASKPAPRAFVA